MKKIQFKKLVMKVTFGGRTFTLNLSYFQENWGAPFIIGFMMLLMTAAGFLCYGLEKVANNLAVYSYYLLVIGVILQFICYLKYWREEDNFEGS